jgi:hypothetical protein
MARRFRIAIATAAVLTGVGLPMLPAQAAGTCSLSGVAFGDDNRNGVQDAGETPRSGDLIYLFNGTGAYVANATTDSSGHYDFASLTCGSYDVRYAANSWWAVRDNLVPTTTGSVLPRQTITLAGAGAANFGWRQIVRSTQVGSPLDTYTGPQGLRVESYDDVISAKRLYDAVLQGNVGPEAGKVTVRFDITASSMTNTSISATAGRYDGFSAVSNVDYVSWLDGSDTTLVHEYGHAWSLYRAYLLQQDPAMTSYLKARGLYGDPRVGSTYAWATNEMVAEDYRQLLGSPTAATAAQTNSDIPLASNVPGLKEFLVGAFSTAAGSSSPSPSPSPSATPTASAPASPAPSPTATPTASPAPTTSPTASPSPSPTTAKRGGCKRC